MTDAIREACDADEAIAFLERIRPGRPWLLYTFKSDDPPRTKSEFRRFAADRKAAVRAQLEIWDRENRNVYFLLANNTERTRREKADIVGADLVWTDLDPEHIDWSDALALAAWQESARARLEGEPPAGVPGPPHFVWSSGRGFWAAWALDQTSVDIAHLEEVNRAIATAYGGDKAHDAARVARLVGTRNSKTGCVGKLITHRDGLQPYPINAFAREKAPVSAPTVEVAEDAGPPVHDVNALALPGWLKSLTVHGVDAPDHDPTVRDTAKPKDRSAALWRAVKGYCRCGLDDAVILSLLLDERWRIGDHLRKPGKEPVREARRTLSRARTAVAGQALEAFGESIELPETDGVSVVVTKSVARFTVDLTRAILQRMPNTIFRRGGELVRVRRLEKDERTGEALRRAGTVEIAPVTGEWLRLALDRAGVTFWKLEDEKAVQISPPRIELRDFIAVGDEHEFDELRSISRTPTLRRDMPGYDPDSKTYLAFEPGDFPPIPVRPTRDDAIEAALRLFGPTSPFRAFPFADAESLSVLGTMLLTGVVRGELRTAPMFIADAPTPGTGKDLLVECAGVIVSGVEPERITWSGDANEPEKRLGALLLAGAQCIQIANIDRPLGGSFLCDVMTAETVNIRVLGESRTPKVTPRALIMASGNNTRVAGDMSRRVLYCRLDARVERPEQRRFDFNALEETKRRRSELVAAALTILRAYDAAERPKPDGHVALGSYEQWNDLIRGALLWLGGPDPIRTQSRAREGDEVRERNIAMLDALERTFGGREFRTDDLDGHDVAAQNARVELAKWLPRGEWSRQLAGRKIGELTDRPLEGRVLRGRTGKGGRMVWRIEPAP